MRFLQNIDVRNVSFDPIAIDSFYRDLIYGRHLIWYKRFVLNLTQPWTNDPILSDYKFTNVYRELDKGTRYYQLNIVGKGDGRQVLFNTLVYRMFNRIETYRHAIGFILDWEAEKADVLARLHAWAEAGKPYLTSAHRVNQYSKYPGNTRIDRMVYLLSLAWTKIDQFYEVVRSAKSLEQIFNFVLSLDGFGKFLAYEVATDVTYTGLTSVDEDSWVHAGPGSQIGLKFVFPGATEVQYESLIWRLRDEQECHFARLGLDFQSIAYMGKRLTLRNIEHSTCEFSKYFKIKTGKGRPKNRFTPTSLTKDFQDCLRANHITMPSKGGDKNG